MSNSENRLAALAQAARSGASEVSKIGRIQLQEMVADLQYRLNELAQVVADMPTQTTSIALQPVSAPTLVLAQGIMDRLRELGAEEATPDAVIERSLRLLADHLDIEAGIRLGEPVSVQIEPATAAEAKRILELLRATGWPEMTLDDLMSYGVQLVGEKVREVDSGNVKASPSPSSNRFSRRG